MLTTVSKAKRQNKRRRRIQGRAGAHHGRIGSMSEQNNTLGNLILLRHGQSEWNASNQFTGWVDVRLTE